MDYRKQGGEHAPIHIDGAAVEQIKGNSTTLERMALQRVMRTAQYITEAELQDIYIRQ